MTRTGSQSNPNSFSSSRSGIPAFSSSLSSNVISSRVQHEEIRCASNLETRGGSIAKRLKRNAFGVALTLGGLTLAQCRQVFGHDVVLSACVITFSLLAALSGVGILLFAWRERQEQPIIAKIKERYPGEFFRWDYPWDKEGAGDKSQKVLSYWLTAALTFALAAPLNFYSFANRAQISFSSALSMLVAVIIDLSFLAIIVRSIYKSIRLLRYGNSRVKFAHFPYVLGENVELTLLEATRLQGCTKIEAKLRCVQERLVVEMIGQKLVERLVAHQVYCETQELKTLASRQDRIKLSFDTPSDPRMSTDLEDDCPRYWELDIRAELPGVDYNSVFLLPIYAKPSDLIRLKNKS